MSSDFLFNTFLESLTDFPKKSKPEEKTCSAGSEDAVQDVGSLLASRTGSLEKHNTMMKIERSHVNSLMLLFAEKGLYSSYCTSS